MKNIFNGVPKRRVVFDLVTAFIYSIMNSIWTHLSVQVVKYKFDNEILKFVFILLIYMVSWRLLEFFMDLHEVMNSTIIENNVSEYYFSKLYKIKPEVLKKNSTGYISGVISKLTNQQSTCYDDLVVSLPCDIAYVGYFSIVLGMHNTILGVTVIGAYILTNIMRIICVNIFVQKSSEELTEAEGIRNRLYIDIISNINTIQKMQAKDFIEDKINEVKVNCINKARTHIIKDEIFFIIAKFIMYSYLPICLIIVYVLDIDSIYNNAATMAMLATVGTQIGHNARGIFRFFTHLSRFRASYEKLDNVLKSYNERKEISDDTFEYVELKDVDYSYIDDNTKNTVRIQIPYFRVNKGDRVCVYGESGQGKTTLLHILSNEIDTDNVYMNGDKLEDRIDCVFIAQDTEILNMSLRDNLSLSTGWSKDLKILEYLDSVGLTEWYDSQPNGLDTMLGERGIFVSTGQRQRLNLIRGLLMSDKEIYLLDEPTSNVDDYTEEKIVELLRNELKDKTVIIVTHRPKIMDICNKKYKFVNGILGECVDRSEVDKWIE